MPVHIFTLPQIFLHSFREFKYLLRTGNNYVMPGETSVQSALSGMQWATVIREMLVAIIFGGF